ncbi:hypothetical protein niasHS_012775 [Heterodera schachtii]|uniref:Uncharacterized protein n=1 Tax=Heterodera schachtii TaxID=97005 RepID=A0ABD2J029_HETSC
MGNIALQALQIVEAAKKQTDELLRELQALSDDELLRELQALNDDGIDTEWLRQRLSEIRRYRMANGIYAWTREDIKKFLEIKRQKPRVKHKDEETAESELVELIAMACRAWVKPQMSGRKCPILAWAAKFNKKLGRKCPKRALKKWAANVWDANVGTQKSGRKCPYWLEPQMSGTQMSDPQMSGTQMWGFSPRLVQILSILLMFRSSCGVNANANALRRLGCLLQIATGEGKTITVAMFAAVKALLDNVKVDVVTCSEGLARRDAQLLAEFYGIFGLSVDDCTDKGSLDKAKCYGADILYGDIGSFQGDILRHEFKAYKKVRGSPARPYESVVIDEADSMLLDQVIEGHLLMLSFSIPGMEYLESLQCLLWFCYTIYEPTPHPTDSRKLLLTVNGECVECDATEFEEQLQKTAELLISGETLKLEDNTTIEIQIPRHLRKFVRQQLPVWFRSIKSAIRMREGREYCVNEGKVVPIDFQNTGIKHGLSMQAETLITCLITNAGFTKKYREVYGMSGTLGNSREQTFLRDTYNTDIVLVPTFAKSKLQQLDPIYADDRTDWIDKIRENVFDVVVRQKRAALIICETVENMTEISGSIVIPELKVHKYASDCDKFPESIKPLDLIYTTNIGGRGTDYNANPELEQNGGMHVILTFMTNNERVQRQAYGRTARKGQEGTALLIVFNSCTIDVRNRFADQVMTNGEQKLLPLITLKEELFSKFAKFYGQIREESKEDERLLSQVEEHWGFWMYEKFDLRSANDEEENNSRPLPSSDVLHREFDMFIQQLRGKISAKDLSIYENPSYLVLKAFDLLCNNDDYSAQKHLEKAIELAGGDTSAFATAAHYFMALALIEKGNYQLQKNDKTISQCRKYQNEALEFYRKAIACADKLREWVSVPLIIKQTEEGTDQLRQINNKIQLLDQLQAKCQECITYIGNCPANRICKLSRWVDPDPDQKKPEMDELREFGIRSFYELGYAKPPKKWGSIIGMGLLGLVQIGIGLACVCYGQFGAAAALIQNGASDIFKAAKAAFGDTVISWAQWGVEKIVSYSITFLKWAGTKIVEKLHLRKFTDAIGLTSKQAALIPQKSEFIKETFFNSISQEFQQIIVEQTNLRIDLPAFQLVKGLMFSSFNAAPIPFKMNLQKATCLFGIHFVRQASDQLIREWVNKKFKNTNDFGSLLGKCAVEGLLRECNNQIFGSLSCKLDENMNEQLMKQMTTEIGGETIRLSESQVKQVKEMLSGDHRWEKGNESEAFQKMKRELGWDAKYDPILSKIAQRTVGMTSLVEKNMDDHAAHCAEALLSELSNRQDWVRMNPSEAQYATVDREIKNWQRKANASIDPHFVPPVIKRELLALISEGESSSTSASHSLPNFGTVIGCFCAIDDNLQGELAPVLNHLYQVDSVDRMPIGQLLKFQEEFMGPKAFAQRSEQVQNQLNEMVQKGVITAQLMNRLWRPGSGFASSAVGAFKFSCERLQMLMAKGLLGRNGQNVLFEQKIQEFLAYQLMCNNGLDNFLANSLTNSSKRKFGIELCKLWASLGVPPGTERTRGEMLTTSSSYYTDNVQAKITWDRLGAALDGVHGELRPPPVPAEEKADKELFNPTRWGQFKASNRCRKCPASSLRAIAFSRVECDLVERPLKRTVNSLRVAAPITLAFIPNRVCQVASQAVRRGVEGLSWQDATHEAIEVLCKCDQCAREIPFTYEIMEEGQTSNRCGRYTKVYRKERIPGIRVTSFEDIERIFNDMPKSYNLWVNNCKMWSTEMIKRLQ